MKRIEEAIADVVSEIGTDFYYLNPPEQRRLEPASLIFGFAAAFLSAFVTSFLEGFVKKAFEELGKKSGEEIGESLADGVAKTLKESLEKKPKGQEAEVEVAFIKASETSQSLSIEQIEFLAIIAQTSVESALLEFHLPSRRARRIAEKVREIAMERFIAFRSAEGKA